jgi:acyl-coenzyme A thioesterase PaaI-like protein
MHRRYTDPPPPTDRAIVTSSDRPVSGPANPTAVAMRIQRAGDGARADVVFDRLFESAPGRVHGGVLAAVFDDIMGYIQVIEGLASYTMELTVRYRAPVPTQSPIIVRARATERTDRRCIVTAEAVANGATDVLADGRGVFAVVPPERLDPPLVPPSG